MNIIVTCHSKDKYSGQNVVGVCADMEKSIVYDFDFNIRLCKINNKYIALTEKTRIPIGEKQWPDRFSWDYKNLINFFGEKEITRPAAQVDNKIKDPVDNKIDNKKKEDELWVDKLELLKSYLKKNGIGAKDFREFLKTSAKWEVSALSKLTLKQLTFLVDNWSNKVLPKYEGQLTTVAQDAPKPEDKQKKSEDKSEDKLKALKKLKLLMEEWKIDPKALKQYLNIKEFDELDIPGLQGVINNFSVIAETFKGE
jgi:hypothetical protein